MTFNEACGKPKKKKKKSLKEGYDVSSYASTSTEDVTGLQKVVGKQIVRRKIKNPVTYVGSIKI